MCELENAAESYIHGPQSDKFSSFPSKDSVVNDKLVSGKSSKCF